jgi:hypothetical protein
MIQMMIQHTTNTLIMFLAGYFARIVRKGTTLECPFLINDCYTRERFAFSKCSAFIRVLNKFFFLKFIAAVIYLNSEHYPAITILLPLVVISEFVESAVLVGMNS